MEPQNSSQKKVGIAVGIVVVIALVIFAVYSSNNSSEQTPVTTPTATPSTEAVPTVSPATTSAYKDGTYTATGSYRSPGGPDQIGVTLTLTNDIVTNASVTPMPGDRESSQYQNGFVSGYKAQVVGKNIADLKLTNVSGSSLTPIGFNDAVAQIKAQAKS